MYTIHVTWVCLKLPKWLIVYVFPLKRPMIPTHVFNVYAAIKAHWRWWVFKIAVLGGGTPFSAFVTRLEFPRGDKVGTHSSGGDLF